MCEDCCPTCGQPYYDAEDGDEYTEMSAEQKAEQALRNSPLGMAAHPDNEAARRAEFERRKKGELYTSLPQWNQRLRRLK